MTKKLQSNNKLRTLKKGEEFRKHLRNSEKIAEALKRWQ